MRKMLHIIPHMCLLVTLTLIGCSSSKQVERTENTTTTIRTFQDSVSVPEIKGEGESSNYWAWRKAISPLLEFIAPAEIPIVEGKDTLGVVTLDLKTGKSTHKIQPPKAPTKGTETITTSTVKTKEDTETESMFEDPLMYVAIILGLLLVGFVIYKFTK